MCFFFNLAARRRTAHPLFRHALTGGVYACQLANLPTCLLANLPGGEQAGVSEALIQAVTACPEALWGPLLDNILVVGGTSRLPNFCERLRREVCSLPSHARPFKRASLLRTVL